MFRSAHVAASCSPQGGADRDLKHGSGCHGVRKSGQASGVVAGRCRIRLRKIIRTASVEQRRRSTPLHEGEISNYSMIWNNGAQERTRTFTTVKPLAPEASASTDSATWAWGA